MLTTLLPKNIDRCKVDIWSQDETRVGQQGSLTRIWAKRGTRPRKVRQQQFISTYIYGAACHETGEACALILPYANTQAMNKFLEELSRSIQGNRHIALLTDNAGWHTAKKLTVPSNITLIPLPPYAPELNAMEQVWEWIKNHFLSNQCYGVYEDIVTMACYAWNQLAHNVDLVKSIMYRDWINTPCALLQLVLYHRFNNSYRDVQEQMAYRGIILSHETVRFWCNKFAVYFQDVIRKRERKPTDKWHLDEMNIKIKGFFILSYYETKLHAFLSKFFSPLYKKRKQILTTNLSGRINS
ncbi:IS630 family transposase [Candidatus Tisiphia endosymbiont of Neophilaenus lineatus]|uniref:IS630 family transposase n=1 Tax=Candidatus Tisiphia endosymbiont of Neophilaenus lineatus TaxID=3139336 RepID=UPI0035CBDA8F